MSFPLAVDTSVAVPLLSQGHADHAQVRAWATGRRFALSGHAGAETCSVLTRLPGHLRLAPKDAAPLIDHWLDAVLTLDAATVARLPHLLSDISVSGGAVYDAMVALAAKEHGARSTERRWRPVTLAQRTPTAPWAPRWSSWAERGRPPSRAARRPARWPVRP